MIKNIIYIILIFFKINSKPNSKKEIEKNLTKIKVFEMNMKYSIKEIFYCNQDKDRILMIDDNGSIYFSSNFGHSWNEFNIILSKIKYFKNNKITYIYQNPLNNDHIILVNENKRSLYSINCGIEFKLLSEYKLINVKFHYFNENLWGLIIFESEIYNLYITKNAGESIKFGKSNVIDFEWNKYKIEENNHYTNRIFYLINYKTKNNDLYYSDDFFNTQFIIKENVEDIILSKHFLIINTQINDSNNNKFIASSFSNFFYLYPIILSQQPSKFYEIKFVEENMNIENYIIAQGFHNGIPLNNLYMNVNNFYFFELIIENIVCDISSNKCDFQVIKSLEGVILLNTYSDKIINKLKLNDNPYNKKHNFLIKKLDKNINTFISFDYGKNFHHLNYNNFVVDNKINLIINKTNDYQGIITSNHVPGLIIALGNIGKYFNSKKLYLLITIDGGLSWERVLKGNYFTEIVNNGSFILTGIRNRKTKYIKFSHDYGKSWQNIQISQSNLLIESFKIEKNKKETKLIIMSKFKKIKIITTLDFDEFYEKKCNFNNDQNLSDFESFIPRNYNSDKDNCFNGREIIYYRKKSNALCYNDDSKPLILIKKFCLCKNKDWHCDFGYEKNEEDKCIKSKNSDMFKNNIKLLKDPLKKCDKYYFDNNGYIKNSYNYCSGGVVHNLEKKNCWSLDFDLGKHLNIYIYLFILLIIIIFLFLGFNSYKKNYKKNKIKKDYFHDGELGVLNKIKN